MKVRVPTEDGRITGEADLRLMLYTVTVKFRVRAKLTEAPPKVYLYAGLPLHLADQGGRVAKVWQGVHQVKINGLPYHVEIAGVKTMSQPHGGLTDYFFRVDGTIDPERKAGLKGTFGVIDIGYRTTDIVRLKYDPALRKIVVDRDYTVGLSDMGAQGLYRRVYKAIYEKYRRNLDDETLVEAVQNRALRDRGATIDLGNVVEEAIAQTVENVASGVVEKAGWTDEIIRQTDTILAIGGTPLLLGKRLKERLPYVIIPPHSQVSCASGLAKAAIMKGVFPDI
jgi:hypothetical protein